MDTNYFQYSIEIGDKEASDMLIAVLSDLGVEGFEEQEGLLYASGKLGEIQGTEIEEYLQLNFITYSKSEIKEQNWNAVWESNFEPVQVEDFVGIRAGFHQPISNVVHEIIITPKMSFGTGHHATTWLMLKVMKELPLQDASIFDFGTGTGILAIMAEKLGAKKVLAVDYDDWCIENAAENFEANGCKAITLEKADSAGQHEPFDIILANINKHVIVKNLLALERNLKYGGDLLLSGLLTGDEIEVMELMQQQPFYLRKKIEKNGWIALHLHKQKSD